MNKLYTVEWKRVSKGEIVNCKQQAQIDFLKLKGEKQVQQLNAKMNEFEILPSTEGHRLDIALKLSQVSFRSEFKNHFVEHNHLIVKLGVPIKIDINGIRVDIQKPIVNLLVKICSDDLVLNSEFEVVLQNLLHENRTLEQVVKQINDAIAGNGRVTRSTDIAEIKVNDDLTTFGWDVVSGMSFANANEKIATQKTFPQTINDEFSDPLFGDASLVGTFQGWQLTNNGDGRNIAIKCTFSPKTTLKIDLGKLGEKKYELDSNYWFEVQLPLTTFDAKDKHMDSTGLNDGQFKELKIKKVDESGETTIILINTSLPSEIKNSPSLTAIVNSLLKNYIEGLVADKNALQHVFSFMQLNETSKTERWQWLKATKVSYAVAPSDSLNESVFAVMYQTTTKKVPDAQQVDGRLLENAKNNAVVVAISKQAYFKNVIYEALPYAEILPKSDMELDEDNMVVYNSKPFTYAFLKDSETKIEVDKKRFRLGFSNNDLQLNVNGQEPFSQGNTSGIIHHEVLEHMTLGFKDHAMWLSEKDSEYTTSVETKNIEQSWFSLKDFAIGVASSLAFGALCYSAIKYSSKIAKIVNYIPGGKWVTSRIRRTGRRFSNGSGANEIPNASNVQMNALIENQRFRIDSEVSDLNEFIIFSRETGVRSSHGDVMDDSIRERTRVVENFEDRFERDSTFIKTGFLMRCVPLTKNNATQTIKAIGEQQLIDLFGDEAIKQEEKPVNISMFWKGISEIIQWPQQTEIVVDDLKCNGVILIQGKFE